MVDSASVIAVSEYTGAVRPPSGPPAPRAMAAAMHMFSNTLSEGKICATWKEREMPSLVISREGMPVMSRPSNEMVPLLGVRWPVTMLTKVVLPAPLAPMTPMVCCDGMSRLMSRAATTEPKAFSRSRTDRIGPSPAAAAACGVVFMAPCPPGAGAS